MTALKAEIEGDPGACSRRRQVAQERAARAARAALDKARAENEKGCGAVARARQ